MRRSLKVGKWRIRFRFYILLLILVGVFVYLATPTAKEFSYALVEQGEVLLRDQSDALVIRQEQVYEVSEYGRVEFLVAQEHNVKPGDLLAMLYEPGFDNELVYQLYDIKQRIFAYQQQNVDYDIDLDGGDQERTQMAIVETVSELQRLLRDDNIDVISMKEVELQRLFAERQLILDKSVAPDYYLQQLYGKEAQINKKLSESRFEVISPAAGMVSFSLDGLEEVLNMNSIENLTIDNIMPLLEGDRDAAEQELDKTKVQFFRIIDTYRWFVVCALPSYKVFHRLGDYVEVRFLERYEDALNGTVYKVMKGEDISIVMIEMSEDITPFINVRNAQVEIGKKVSGLIVPLDAIVERRGEKGVVVLYGDSSIFVQITIRAIGDRYAVIEDQTDGREINLNTRVQVR